jgi:hypothetical protein
MFTTFFNKKPDLTNIIEDRSPEFTPLEIHNPENKKIVLVLDDIPMITKMIFNDFEFFRKVQKGSPHKDIETFKLDLAKAGLTTKFFNTNFDDFLLVPITTENAGFMLLDFIERHPEVKFHYGIFDILLLGSAIIKGKRVSPTGITLVHEILKVQPDFKFVFFSGCNMYDSDELKEFDLKLGHRFKLEDKFKLKTGNIPQNRLNILIPLLED